MSAAVRTVFMGTPDFAVPSLRALTRDPRLEVVGVWTQPDRPAGRGHRLTPPPVAEAARALGIATVEQPESLKPDEAFDRLVALAPDLIVVAAYGQILRRRVLDLPRFGCVNVHASLLPRWRGAAPIHRALEAGDRETGVCIMRMEAGLDTGPVYLRRATPIAEDDVTGDVHDRLAVLGADALLEALDRIMDPTFAPQPQAEVGVTYASKLQAADRAVRFDRPAHVVRDHIHAMSPSPGARAMLGGEWIGVYRAAALRDDAAAAPGTIVAASPAGIDVAAAEGTVRLLDLQRPGKRRSPPGDFVQALPGLVGMRMTLE